MVTREDSIVEVDFYEEIRIQVGMSQPSRARPEARTMLKLKFQAAGKFPDYYAPQF